MPRSVSKEHMVLISVHLPKTMLEKLDEMAMRDGISRSELIRVAIRLLLVREQQPQVENPYLTIGR